MADRVAENGPGPWLERAGCLVEDELGCIALPNALMLEVFGHARECYPEECCGLVLGVEEVESWRPLRCANVQSARKARGESDLDATQAFWIDEQELVSALQAAEKGGESLRAIYHSHVNTRAYLSHADLRGATAQDGQPLWPGVAHVVVSVWEDGVREAAWFDWDRAAQRFRGRLVDGT